MVDRLRSGGERLEKNTSQYIAEQIRVVQLKLEEKNLSPDQRASLRVELSTLRVMEQEEVNIAQALAVHER